MVKRKKYIRVHCHSGLCGHPKFSQYKTMHFWLKMIEEYLDMTWKKILRFAQSQPGPMFYLSGVTVKHEEKCLQEKICLAVN